MFKRGIIWNDDPDADDTIKVTVVATGFEYNKLNKITNVDLGNLIILDNDYTFSKKRAMDSEEGRSLPATEGGVIQTIGFTTQSNHPVFDENERKGQINCGNFDNGIYCVDMDYRMHSRE